MDRVQEEINMNISHFVIILIVYIGSFFFMPDRIMLSMANRLGVDFHKRSKKFKFYGHRRVLFLIVSIILTFISTLSEDWSIFVPASLASFFISIFTLDFITIEGIFKEDN